MSDYGYITNMMFINVLFVDEDYGSFDVDKNIESADEAKVDYFSTSYSAL